MDAVDDAIQEMWDTAEPGDVLHYETHGHDGPRPTGPRSSTLVVCPYVEIQPATRIFLTEVEDGNVDYRRVDGDFGYCRLLREMWARGDEFIVVEQDVVPWGGATAHLCECDRPWCLFGYRHDSDFTEQTAHMGCVKFGSALIEATRGVWDADTHWSQCDLLLDRVGREAGLVPHQHYPHVLNANPFKIQGGALAFPSVTVPVGAASPA